MAIRKLNIPALSSKVDSSVKQAFLALKSWVEGMGQLITAEDLAALPLLTETEKAALSPYTSTVIPPALAGFTVTGAFAAIMVAWDEPHYAHFAYVEVWRSTSDDLGTAVMVGTTSSTMYADTPPQSSLSVNYYYWARIVSRAKVVGPFNAVGGTVGATASDPLYLMQVLAAELDNVTPTPSVPDLVFAVNRFGLKMGTGDAAVYPFIVAEVPDSPGTYGVFIDTAYIKNASIASAKIASLSADKLTVPGTTSIWDAIITTGKITNAYIGDTIQSTAYTPGSVGWTINKNGTVEFNGGTFRGTVHFTSDSSGYDHFTDKPDLTGNDLAAAWVKPGQTTIDGNKIYTGDAYVDTLQIKGNACTVAISISGGISSSGTDVVVMSNVYFTGQPVIIWCKSSLGGGVGISGVGGANSTKFTTTYPFYETTTGFNVVNPAEGYYDIVISGAPYSTIDGALLEARR